MPQKPGAVIFDMDGLMIDSEGNQSVSYEKVLREHGVEPQYDAHGVIQVVGMRAVDNWKRLKDKHDLAASVEELMARKKEIYHALLREGVQIQPGLIELLADLKTKDIKRAIASSSTRGSIDLVIGHLGLHDYFDAIVSGEDVIHGKPAPDIYLKATRLIDVSPGDCVALEDAGEGVAAAKAAGMKVIAVPNLYTEKQDFSEADLVIGSLQELSWDVISRL